jgi:hypothetical protein
MLYLRSFNRFILISLMMLVILAAMMARPASASAVYQLDVNYTQGSIISGPLSFGLSALPTSVSATFMLGAGTIGSNSILFSRSDVVSADVSFGDASWTENLLDTFNFIMSLTPAAGDTLNYAFLPITTQLTDGSIVLNFPLSITGTDIASGQSFEYGYTESTHTFSASAVPVPAAVWLFGTALIGFIGMSRRRKVA